MSKKAFTAYAEEDDLEKVKEIAKEERRSLSSQIALIIDEWLNSKALMK